MNPEKYNKRSMVKYGWTRSDVGLSETATLVEVTKAVQLFQKEAGVAQDGKVGPVTHRRILANREFAREHGKDQCKGSLLIGGKVVSVDFDAVQPNDIEGLSLISKRGHGKRWSTPTQVVWHWDCCFSAKSCHRVLSRRNISSHGCIDNDGRFYQFLDFTKHKGWHAGTRGNKNSIGIDVTNAVYSKYQLYYNARWGDRPLLEGVVTNGRRHKPFLGYYPSQIETAKKLALFLNSHLGIELVTPESSRALDKPEIFKGHIAHYHITPMQPLTGQNFIISSPDPNIPALRHTLNDPNTFPCLPGR